MALIASVLIFVASLPMSVLADTAEPQVEIVDFESISIIEGTRGNTTSEYDPVTGKNVEYFRYYYFPKFTVTLKDGTVLKPDGGMTSVNYNGNWYSPSCTDDQSCSNQWGVGTHTVTASIMGYETSFTVEITENPVAKVDVENISIIENTDGSWRYGYSSDAKYYHYNYTPEFTVTLKDNTVLTSEYGSITYNGNRYSLSYTDDQSYSNQWGVGTHIVKAEILGYDKASFEVEIIESPVAKVDVENISIMENTSGSKTSEYNPVTGESIEYYRYSYTPKFTVTLKDNTVLTSEYGGITYNGNRYWLSYNDNQSYSNQWGVGTHIVKVEILGYDKASFEVEIVKTPITKIEFESISIMEGTNGSRQHASNPDVEYYHYNYMPKYTVTLKDNTVLTSEYGSITYNGNRYSLFYTDGQSYSNQWGVGTHTVKASLMGYETSFTVEIAESPYRFLEILEVEELTEYKNSWENSNGDIIYSLPNVIFRVTDKYGKSFIVSTRDYSSLVSVSDNQSECPWLVGGDNRFTLNYVNLSIEVPVTIKPGSPFEYIEQGDGLYITGYRLYNQKSLEIPSEINGKPVVGVLSLNAAFESITIPDSVETIGESALNNIYGLKTVVLGKGVKYLDITMFAYCSQLERITVSAENPYYCDLDGVVYNKDKNTLVVYPLAKGNSYTVPATVTNIDLLNNPIYAFLNYSFTEDSKQFVTVDGVTYNADKTKILSCSKEKTGDYVMPDSVTEIAEYAFNECAKLETVKISNGVTSIAYATFADCSALSQIELPSNLVTLADYAFAGCSQLSEVSLPKSVMEIGSCAFAQSGLKQVAIPEGIEEIQAGTFSGCRKLTNITIPSSVTHVGSAAFSGCTNLADITLPTRITHIGGGAFAYCKSLTNIGIPDSVTQISSGAFSYCTGLTSVTLSANITKIDSLIFEGCTSLTSIIIPDKVTFIDFGAFRDCTSLKEVVFKNPQIEIGEGAFSGCALKKLSLPKGSGTTDATKPLLSNSVTRIGYRSFAGCSDLSEIDIPETVMSISGGIGDEYWNSGAFSGTAWERAQPDGEVYLKHIFYGYKGSKTPENGELRIKDGTTVIADFALDGANWLKSLTLPEGLKVIGSWAFFACDKIETIDIPASVDTIYTSAFGNCSSLTAIHVSPDNPHYMSVDGVLFSKDGTKLLWCPKRESSRYEVPNTVTNITTGAFSNSNVSTIVIQNPETELAEYAVGYRLHGDSSHIDTYPEFSYAGGYFEHDTVEIVCSENSKAHAYAKANQMFAIVPTEISVKTDDGKVAVSATTDIISENATLSVTEKSIKDMDVSKVDPKRYDIQMAAVFSIFMEKSGICVQPDGKITVSIKVPEKLNGRKCAVLYIDAAGHVTDMKAIYREGYMHFQTDHFSDYMIVESTVNYIPGDLDGDGKINSLDGLLLLRHLNGWDVDIAVPEAMDVNGDGKVTSLDGLMLQRYLNGWDVTLGKEQ